jgi:hypothetical protein
MPTQIIQYSLLWINGQGFVPNQQVKYFGCEFDGGLYPYKGTLIGYVTGPDQETLDICLSGLNAFNAIKLDDKLMAERVLEATGTYFVDETGKIWYYTLPTINPVTGKIVQEVSEDDPGIVLNEDQNLMLSEEQKKRLRDVAKFRTATGDLIIDDIFYALVNANSFDDFKNKVAEKFL